ncbi:UvrD-helicase domain-containing protein [Halomicrobium mukohataei]|uniref:DNA 3'-5' helicase n=2 Tax=Halomicrobium mukohataei TaxID=57705 RepID=C7P509_HALMD|nr:UvrD-helicase domain-containing protein [Halomicrobium mukohataei]ACV49404.1 ATP-dependent exoDNAse (exonuclease V) beta subunit-like protein (contains helicase and exonuclease domains) [Halomicrobium mukohataei DSM 12286]QCD67231.1 exonuclease V subunit beta [Halomicrobium mukohataei]
MTDGVPPLEGAQDRIRDAFLAHDRGLFVLDCTAGFGKSTTVERVAAEALVEAGAQAAAPERGLCVVSFSREDAAGIVPGITAALAAFADDEQPTATTISPERSRRLQERVRHADHVGTIDSIFRTVFTEIHAEYGFEQMPTVGNDARLSSLREAALDALRGRESLTARFDRLDEAYGDETASDGRGADGRTLDTLLETARSAKRARRLSDEQFRDRLLGAIDEAFPDGRPATFDAVVRDVARFFDEETAAAFRRRHDDEAAVTAQSRACFDRWRARVEEFCSLVVAYETEYDRRCRERGVLAHQDVAYWVADFFDESGDADDSFRERVRQRHAHALQTLVIDEAQDVSVAQHDALAPLVPDDARVLLAGDTDQCIYAWRDARPALFTRAFDEGTYFGRSWTPHERADAARTYRMRPDVSAAVDAVFETVFTDPARGAVHRTGDGYAPVETDREATSEPAVHVASYRARGSPGTTTWFEESEAAPLSNYLHGALADDGFAGRDADGPVEVLFPTRTNMRSLAARLEAKGLSVADASELLFETPLVELVVGVVEWLVDPFDPERTRALFDGAVPAVTCDDGSTVREIAAAADYRLDEIGADDRLPARVETFLDDLAELRGRLARRTADPGALVVATVVETLALGTDPFDQVDDPRRCLAVLDTLVETVESWEGTDRYSLSELAGVLQRYRASPSHGPLVPVPDDSDYDVVFRTIHNAKGDEADIVCLADLSRPLGVHGPHRDSFVARGETLALAPPATAPSVPVDEPSAHGVESVPRLRWATNRWVGDEQPRLGGPPVFSELAAAHRADRWRTLYVAMTRARDHLVLSVPRDATSHGTPPQDSWVTTIRRALALPDSLERGRIDTALQRPTGEYPLAIGCLDVAYDASVSQSSRPTPRTALAPSPTRTGRTPRFVNGSTLYPLATGLDEHWLAHLKGAPLHSDRPAPDDGLPLAFDAVGPDDLGTIAHDVLTTAVDRGVSTATLEDCAEPLAGRLDAAIDEQCRDVGGRERQQVASYVRETVCPQFASTGVWERLQSSAVYVEEPLDAVLPVADHTIETRNHADIVSRAPDGTWYVDDIKLVLADTDATRDRYALQTAFYAWLLERQLDDATVRGRITCVGERVDSTAGTAPVDDIESWLARFA